MFILPLFLFYLNWWIGDHVGKKISHVKIVIFLIKTTNRVHMKQILCNRRKRTTTTKAERHNTRINIVVASVMWVCINLVYVNCVINSFIWALICWWRRWQQLPRKGGKCEIRKSLKSFQLNAQTLTKNLHVFIGFKENNACDAFVVCSSRKIKLLW